MLAVKVTLLLIFQIFVKVNGDPVRNNVANLSIPSNFVSNCTASCVVSCPKGWEKFEGHCYLWSQDEKSWLEAEDTCQSHGGHLASMKDKKTYDFVLGKGARIWIGGTDRVEEGKWVWTDCSPWDYTQGWKKGEPNSYDGDEDCIEMSFRENSLIRTMTDQTGFVGEAIQKMNPFHGWNDEVCSRKQKYVCNMKICSGSFRWRFKLDKVRPPKKRDYLRIFPNMGGGSSQFPKPLFKKIAIKRP